MTGWPPGRVCVILAAVLWSTSGAFVGVLQMPERTVAVYRSLAAGGVLLVVAAARRAAPPPVIAALPMIACFAAMNYLYIAALTHTSAANAVLTQYTAPLWMTVFAVLALGEPFDRRRAGPLAVAMLGVALLVAGSWREAGVWLGLGSGVAFAGVTVFMRAFRGRDPMWLAIHNNLGAGLLLAGLMALLAGFGADPSARRELAPPGWSAGLVLLAFGAFQMAVPYVLYGQGLRTVSPQEAGLLALLEPLLNPVWAYLAAGQVPSQTTVLGGAFFLAALAWSQLLPARVAAASNAEATARAST